MDSMTHPTDTAKSEELEACEKCGAKSDSLNLNFDAVGFDRLYHVHCENCGHEVGHFSLRIDAIAAWNRRSSPPQNDAGVVIASLRKRYLAGARDSSGARKDRTRCSHYVQVLDELSAALRTPMSELQALGQEFEAGWRPYIGQEVRAASHIVEKWPDWQDTRLWVVGIAKDRIGNQYPVDGINVTVSDEWPVTSKTGGFTDGFYIGRQFEADDLIPSAPSGEV